MDFSLDHVFEPGNLPVFLNLIQEKKNKGVFTQREPALPDSLASLLKNETDDPGSWEKRRAFLQGALETLRSDVFYLPGSLLAARGELEKWLGLFSLAYYPSCVYWDRFYNLHLTDWPQMREFCEDSLANPFLALCGQGLAERFDSSEPGLVVFLVTSSGQAAAALTMARFCKKERPNLQVALWGDHPVCIGPPPTMTDFWDYLPLGRESAPLMETAARLAGLEDAAPCPTHSSADYFLDGPTLERYLAPETVLSLDQAIADKDGLGQLAGRLVAERFSHRGSRCHFLSIERIDRPQAGILHLTQAGACAGYEPRRNEGPSRSGRKADTMAGPGRARRYKAPYKKLGGRLTGKYMEPCGGSRKNGHGSRFDELYPDQPQHRPFLDAAGRFGRFFIACSCGPRRVRGLLTLAGPPICTGVGRSGPSVALCQHNTARKSSNAGGCGRTGGPYTPRAKTSPMTSCRQRNSPPDIWRRSSAWFWPGAPARPNGWGII